MLYKDVLRLDSCEASAGFIAEMNESLLEQLSLADDQIKTLEFIVDNLNKQLESKDITIKIKEDQIKIYKRKAFWNGVKTGAGGSVVAFILVLVLIF